MDLIVVNEETPTLEIIDNISSVEVVSETSILETVSYGVAPFVIELSVGPQGPMGPQGPAGSGEGGSLPVGGTTGQTLLKLSNTDGHVAWGDVPEGAEGPAGPAGSDGDDGASAYQVAVNNGFIGSESQWLDSLEGPQGIQGEPGVQGIQGEPGTSGANGDDGASATLAVGTVSTLSPGSSVTVVNVGTPLDAIINFGIPQGATGTPGTNGSDGSDGAPGADGQSATVAIGTVNTLAAGASATVSNSGTSLNAIINFGIPQGSQGIQGVKGDTGDQGIQGVPGPSKNIIQSVDASDDIIGEWTVADDGTNTDNWVNRFSIKFDPLSGETVEPTAFNEYGEYRGMPAKTSTVAWRLFEKQFNTSTNHSTTTPIAEVMNNRTDRVSQWSILTGGRVEQEGSLLVNDTITATGDVIAPNIGEKVVTWATGSEPSLVGVPDGTLWIEYTP